MQHKSSKARIPTVNEALLPIMITILALFTCLAFLHVPLFWGLIPGTLASWILGRRIGYSWSILGQAAWSGVKSTLPVSIILLAIALLVSSWMASGTVAALIVTGLEILSPRSMLLAAFALTMVLSMILGSGVATLSTLGVALMGVGQGLGLPAPVIAGALVSGASVGDRTSPFSGNCNLVSSVCTLRVWDTIKSLLPTTIGAVLGTGIFYWYLNHTLITGSFSTGTISRQLAAEYQLHWLLFVPPLLVLAGVVMRLQARTSLFLGALAGVILALTLQNVPIPLLARDLLIGYTRSTGSAIDSLMQGGGIIRMLPTFMLLSAAGMFNGLTERIGSLEKLTGRLLTSLNRPETMKAAGMSLGTVMTLIFSSQAIPVLLTGRLLSPHFSRLRLTSTTLARVLSDSIVVLAALIPWNMYGILITSILGISPLDYALYAPFLWLTPLLSLIYTK